MNHIERKKLYAEMADVAQKEHCERPQEKRKEGDTQSTVLKLKEYGFDQQHVDEIFKKHFDEFFKNWKFYRNCIDREM